MKATSRAMRWPQPCMRSANTMPSLQPTSACSRLKVLGGFPRRCLRCDHARSHAGSARRRDRAYRRSCASIAERSEGVWTGTLLKPSGDFSPLARPVCGHPTYVASHTDVCLKERAAGNPPAAGLAMCWLCVLSRVEITCCPDASTPAAALA